jgi:hypothetical protein
LRSRLSRTFLELTLFFWAAGALAAETNFYNGTAATVGKTLITIQDARFYRAISRFVAGEPKALESETGDALRKTVQKMAFEEMVFLEMKAIQFEGGSRAQLEEPYRKARASDGKRGVLASILKTFGRTESEAADTWFRIAQVERFLQKKVETLTPIVTLKEVEVYYNQNRDRFKGSNFDALRPSIEVLLKKERMRKGLEEWIRFLRDKYGVVNHLAA